MATLDADDLLAIQGIIDEKINQAHGTFAVTANNVMSDKTFMFDNVATLLDDGGGTFILIGVGIGYYQLPDSNVALAFLDANGHYPDFLFVKNTDAGVDYLKKYSFADRATSDFSLTYVDSLTLSSGAQTYHDAIGHRIITTDVVDGTTSVKVYNESLELLGATEYLSYSFGDILGWHVEGDALYVKGRAGVSNYVLKINLTTFALEWAYAFRNDNLTACTGINVIDGKVVAATDSYGPGLRYVFLDPADGTLIGTKDLPFAFKEGNNTRPQRNGAFIYHPVQVADGCWMMVYDLAWNLVAMRLYDRTGVQANPNRFIVQRSTYLSLGDALGGELYVYMFFTDSVSHDTTVRYSPGYPVMSYDAARAADINALTAQQVDTQLSSTHGASAWGTSMVLPAIQGQVYTAVATQSREVTIVRGDTPRIVFDLGADYTGWTPKFGAKTDPAAAAYVIAVKDAVWTSEATGVGYIDLTATETATAGRLYAELELRNGASRLTAIKFILKIIEDVVK